MKFTPSYEGLVHKCAYLKERLLKLQISYKVLSTENAKLRARATLLKTWADQRSAEIVALRTENAKLRAAIQADVEDELMMKARIDELVKFKSRVHELVHTH